MIDYYEALIKKFPILSIEDGLAEDDWKGWKMMTVPSGKESPIGRRRPLRHQPEAPLQGHPRRGCQCDSDQAQPDRDVDRDP